MNCNFFAVIRIMQNIYKRLYLIEKLSSKTDFLLTSKSSLYQVPIVWNEVPTITDISHPILCQFSGKHCTRKAWQIHFGWCDSQTMSCLLSCRFVSSDLIAWLESTSNTVHLIIWTWSSIQVWSIFISLFNSASGISYCFFAILDYFGWIRNGWCETQCRVVRYIYVHVIG